MRSPTLSGARASTGCALRPDRGVVGGAYERRRRRRDLQSAPHFWSGGPPAVQIRCRGHRHRIRCHRAPSRHRPDARGSPVADPAGSESRGRCMSERAILCGGRADGGRVRLTVRGFGPRRTGGCAPTPTTPGTEERSSKPSRCPPTPTRSSRPSGRLLLRCGAKTSKTGSLPRAVAARWSALSTYGAAIRKVTRSPPNRSSRVKRSAMPLPAQLRLDCGCST